MSAPPTAVDTSHGMANENRVLVVRLSAMGDIIHALPAITALRQARPDLKIGWLVEERWVELLCARESDRFAPCSAAKPLADWVHTTNFAAWRRALFSGETWHEAANLYREVRNRQYQVALDLQGAIRSALMAAASGAGMRVGAAQPRERAAQMFYTRSVAVQGAHVVQHALSLASELAGRELEYVEPCFPVDGAAERWAAEFTAAGGGKPLAILNPGAGWGAKCWPARSFGAVARSLAERGMAVAVNYGPGEEALAQEVQRSSGGVATPVNCSVGELMALTRRAGLFIGGDTGPMHLAAALRVPVVALFGPTRPERNGPFATRNVVLRSADSRDDTSHASRADAGLVAITPEAVLTAARGLLEGCNG